MKIYTVPYGWANEKREYVKISNGGLIIGDFLKTAQQIVACVEEGETSKHIEITEDASSGKLIPHIRKADARMNRYWFNVEFSVPVEAETEEGARELLADMSYSELIENGNYYAEELDIVEEDV